jgi:hypothetical protein
MHMERPALGARFCRMCKCEMQGCDSQLNRVFGPRWCSVHGKSHVGMPGKLLPWVLPNATQVRGRVVCATAGGCTDGFFVVAGVARRLGCLVGALCGCCFQFPGGQPGFGHGCQLCRAPGCQPGLPPGCQPGDVPGCQPSQFNESAHGHAIKRPPVARATRDTPVTAEEIAGIFDVVLWWADAKACTNMHKAMTVGRMGPRQAWWLQPNAVSQEATDSQQDNHAGHTGHASLGTATPAIHRRTRGSCSISYSTRLRGSSWCGHQRLTA